MENLSGPLGAWTRDEASLPCFDLRIDQGDHPYTPMRHLIGSGRLSGFADRWGNLGLFTTEGGQGFVDISANVHLCRSGLYSMARVNGELISLVPGELRPDGLTRYGCGYAEYSGRTVQDAGADLAVRQVFAAGAEARPFIYGFFEIENLSDSPLELQWIIASDISLIEHYPKRLLEPTLSGPGMACLGNLRPDAGGDLYRLPGEQAPTARPGIGDLYLVSGDEQFVGGSVSLVAIGLRKALTLAPGERQTASACVGYGDADERREAQRAAAGASLDAIRQGWKRRLAPAAPAGSDDWVRDECLWTYGQLLAFTNFDSSIGEHYVSLGGYGWRGFNQRELGEVAMVLAGWDRDLARAQLRYMAKTQWPNGDMPKGHNFRYRSEPPAVPAAPDCSDPEIWFLLGATCVALAGDTDALDEPCPWTDGGQASLWEHMQAAFRHIRDDIGAGAHGLVRFVHGDWNDFLGPMGARGEGESMMNTGMACRAYAQLIELAQQRGEDDFADEIRGELDRLRQAAGRAFAEDRFVRGYTDDGLAVGTPADGRVFINAQSWPALGGCGSQDQRRRALQTAIDACRTDLGLCLVSKAYPSPPPPDIAHCPIPAGEGENGGVWPQAVGWMIWALAEAGMTEQARAVWERMTLRNHYRMFPDVPFGVFNGPDCYNSHLAGPRAHWTQVQLWDRRVHTPMNPAVAWQAFAMRKIAEAEGEVT